VKTRIGVDFYRDLHDDLRLIVLPFMPLWGVAGFHVVEAPISTCSAVLKHMVVVWAAVAVGKTIDIPTLPVGRVGVSWIRPTHK